MNDSPLSLPVAACAPGPDARWLMHHAREQGANALRFLRDIVAEFGDTVHYCTPFGPVYFFNHLDGVREVLHQASIERSALVTLSIGQGLLASDGPYWRAQRNIAQPSLHPSCMEGFAPLITRATDEMMASWHLEIGEERPLDMAREMRVVILHIIMRAMFSADWSSHAASLCEAVGVLVEDLGAIAGTIFNLPARITPDRNARFGAALATINREVYALINARRADANPPRDLLSAFMSARDAQTGAALTDVQLRDEIVSMMIAGHETTAITLAWALHLLAAHPDCAAAMRAEARAIAGERAPTLDDLPNLVHCERAFMETMRLYPPVWMMGRRAIKTVEIAGVAVPANATVLISPYTTHRHAEFWDEPERFNPARFIAIGAQKRPLYAFYPFAGGRHLCMGQRFAIIEGQMILAMMLARFEFRAQPAPPIEPMAALTLRQRGRLDAGETIKMSWFIETLRAHVHRHPQRRADFSGRRRKRERGAQLRRIGRARLCHRARTARASHGGQNRRAAFSQRLGVHRGVLGMSLRRSYRGAIASAARQSARRSSGSRHRRLPAAARADDASFGRAWQLARASRSLDARFRRHRARRFRRDAA